jgi:Flp pilus assembly protein TadG
MHLRASRRFTRAHLRRGVAAVELALVTAVLIVPLMIGVWEMGRLIQVTQDVSTSARVGARVAAQGYTVNSSGTPTQVTVGGADPSVQNTVYASLLAAGYTNLQKSDVTVTFQFLAPKSDGTTPTEPYLGEKGQPFSVTVTIPWNKVRWVNLGVINPTQVSFTVTWRMLVDDAFTIDQNLPTW